MLFTCRDYYWTIAHPVEYEKISAREKHRDLKPAVNLVDIYGPNGESQNRGRGPSEPPELSSGRRGSTHC